MLAIYGFLFKLFSTVIHFYINELIKALLI